MIFEFNGAPAIMLTDRIAMVANARSHWPGTAYLSYHSYGAQQHRSLGDAQRWVDRQDALGAERATARRERRKRIGI